MSFESDQNNYATLIKSITNFKLSNQKTISEEFTLYKLPLWDVFAPELAWRHLTVLLASKSIVSRVKLWFKPFFLKIKSFCLLNFSFKNKKFIDKSYENIILCLALTPRMYSEVLLPIVEKLAKQGTFQILILTWNNKNETMWIDQPNIVYQSIWSFWGKSAKSKRQKLSLAYDKSLEKLFRSNLKTIPINSVINISQDNINLLFRLLFKGFIPASLDQAAIAWEIIEKYNPKLVLSSDISDSRTRLYSLFAKSLDISTFDVQFGLTGNEAIEWHFFKSDKVAAWGDISETVFREKGISKNKIVKYGSPRHDIFYNIIPKTVKNLKLQLGINLNNKVILLASTFLEPVHDKYTSEEVLKDMKKSFYRSINNQKNVTTIIKTHPHEKLKNTMKLIPKNSSIIYADKDIDIRYLIMVCDIFVSFGSTATIDALIAKKPAICPAFKGWPFCEVFEKTQAVFTPKTSLELIGLIDKLIKSEKNVTSEMFSCREKFISEVTSNVKGDAACKISNAILSEIN